MKLVVPTTARRWSEEYYILMHWDMKHVAMPAMNTLFELLHSPHIFRSCLSNTLLVGSNLETLCSQDIHLPSLRAVKDLFLPRNGSCSVTR
jgi:hypothetical protein